MATATDTRAYLTDELVKELQDRLARLAGHAQAIRRMLDEKDSCEDLLVQAAALKGAASQIVARLLEGHLETCVGACVEAGEGRAAFNKLRPALVKMMRQLA